MAQGAVGMAQMLGCNPIALIGQDLAFTDGRAYAKGTAYDFVEVAMKEDGNCRFDGMNEKAAILKESAPHPENGGMADQRVVWVDAWEEGEKVPTWRAYALPGAVPGDRSPLPRSWNLLDQLHGRGRPHSGNRA